MTEHNRDKDQENYLLDQARTIRDEIEVSVFGPSGIDTPPCAEAWATAKLIAKLHPNGIYSSYWHWELKHRHSSTAEHERHWLPASVRRLPVRITS